MHSDKISQPNEGPFDKRIFPPKWAFEPISDEDYQKQKAEYEAISTTEDGVAEHEEQICECGHEQGKHWYAVENGTVSHDCRDCDCLNFILQKPRGLA